MSTLTDGDWLYRHLKAFYGDHPAVYVVKHLHEVYVYYDDRRVSPEGIKRYRDDIPRTYYVFSFSMDGDEGFTYDMSAYRPVTDGESVGIEITTASGITTDTIFGYVYNSIENGEIYIP